MLLLSDGRSIFSVDLLAERLFKCPVIDMDEYHHMVIMHWHLRTVVLMRHLSLLADMNGSKIGAFVASRRLLWLFVEIHIRSQKSIKTIGQTIHHQGFKKF